MLSFFVSYRNRRVPIYPTKKVIFYFSAFKRGLNRNNSTHRIPMYLPNNVDDTIIKRAISGNKTRTDGNHDQDRMRYDIDVAINV